MNSSKFSISFAVVLIFLIKANPMFAGNDRSKLVYYSGYMSALNEINVNLAKMKSESSCEVNPVYIQSIPKDWPKAANSSLSIQKKKDDFYTFMLPLALSANAKVKLERDKLISIKNMKKNLSLSDIETIKELSLKYHEAFTNKDPLKRIDKLLSKVDTVPVSIILAQASYESAYGSSRFAIEGNSLFGQWTYQGGIKPKAQRTKTKGDYRIASYSNLQASVDGYLLNLNSSSAYEQMRINRYNKRSLKMSPRFTTISRGLSKYSEQGETYIKTLNSIVRVNELYKLDSCYLSQSTAKVLVEKGSFVAH